MYYALTRPQAASKAASAGRGSAAAVRRRPASASAKGARPSRRLTAVLARRTSTGTSAPFGVARSMAASARLSSRLRLAASRSRSKAYVPSSSFQDGGVRSTRRAGV